MALLKKDTFRKTILHPLFVYAIIALLSCLTRDDNAHVLQEMPLTGDNFRTKDDGTIYYYNGAGKYLYTSAECYFSYGNPSFAKHYSQGGVKIIAQSFADRIPLMGNMCDDKKIAAAKTNIIIQKRNVIIPAEMYFSKGFLLANFSELAHVGCYMILALSVLLYIPGKRNKYLITFGLCLTGGIILEFIQHFFIFGREASFQDAAMNSMGTLAGMLIYWKWDHRFKKWAGL